MQDDPVKTADDVSGKGRKSRKRFLLLGLGVFTCLLVLIALVGVILTSRPGVIRPRLVAFLNSSVLHTPDAKIGISRLSGNAFKGMVAEGVTLKYRTGGRWVEFISVPKVRIRYELLSFLSGDPRIHSLALEYPRVIVGRDANGKLVFPSFGKKKGGGGKLTVASIELKGARVFLEPDTRNPFLTGLNATGSIIEDGGTTGVLLKKGSFAIRGRVIKDLSGVLESKDGKLELKRLVLGLGESRVVITGNLDGDKFAGVATLDKVKVSDLWGAYSGAACPLSGVLNGQVKLTGSAGTADISVSLTGEVLDTRINKLESRAYYAGNLLRISSFSLVTRDGTISGKGSLESGGKRRFEGDLDLASVGVGSVLRLAGAGGGTKGQVTGRVTVEGESPSPGATTCSGHVELTRGEIEGVRMDSLSASIRYSDHAVLVDSLRLEGDGIFFTCSGSLDAGKRLDMPFTGWVDGRAVKEFMRTGTEVEGLVAINGRITGDISTPKIEADGEMVNLMWDYVGARKGRFSLTDGSISRQPVFSLILELDGCKFKGLEVCDLRLDCMYKEKLFVRELTVSHGDSSIAISSEILPSNGTAKGVITGGSIILGRTSWALLSPSEFSVSRRGIKSDALIIESEEGTITAAFSVDFDTKEVQGDITIRDLNLEKSLPAAAGIGSGMLNCRVTISGSYESPSVNCHVRIDSAVFREQKIEQVTADFAVSSRKIQIKQCEIFQGRNKAVLTGTAFLPGPVTDLLKSAGRKKMFEGTIGLDLAFSSDGFDLEEFNRMSRTLEGAQGRGAFSLLVRGTLERPIIFLDTEFKDVVVQGVQFGTVSARAGYKDGLLTVDELGIAEGGTTSHLNGELPMDISLAAMKISFRDKPMEGVLRMPKGDFRISSLFLKTIASTNGTVSGNVELKGTPYAPEIFGSLGMESGTLRLSNRDELVRDIEAKVVFEKKLIRITSFTGKEGKKGIVEGSGVITLGRGWLIPADYEFRIKATDFTVTDNENYAASLDADLKIAPGYWPDGTRTPKVTGTTTLNHTIVRKEFSGLESMGPPAPGAAVWLFDVAINVPGNFWIKNSDAELELSGTLNARNGSKNVVVLGSMRVVRGQYLLIDSDFKITSGTLEFTDVDKIDPIMDIVAVTKVAGEEITLRVTGRGSKPVPEFSSASGRSQSEIIELLAVRKYWLGSGTDMATSQTADTLGAAGQANKLALAYPVGNYLLKKLEKEITGKVEWIDVLEFSSGGTQGFPSAGRIQVGVGKYLTPELYMKYSKGLTTASDQDVLLEYRFSNLVSLNGRAAKKRVLKGSEEYEYNLDLKFKVEY